MKILILEYEDRDGRIHFCPSMENRDITIITLPNGVKLIEQNMLLVLDCDGERKLAIHHTKLIQSDWTPIETCSVSLTGLNLDTVWENLITQVGGIEVEQGHSLDEQIAADEQKAKLEKEIARLEKQARNEKQPKKKFELVEKIKKLQKEVK